MFGRERSRRTYRVYAEDDFFGDREPVAGGADDAAGLGFGAVQDAAAARGLDDTEASAARRFDGPDAYGGGPSDNALPYTAPRRTLPGPLEGRFGVVLLALVAMAISALVVHLLRASLDGGEAAPRPSLAASSPPVSTRGRQPVNVRGGRRVAARGDVRMPSDAAARAGAQRSGGAAHNDLAHLDGAPSGARRDWLRGAAPAATSVAAGGVANPLDPARARGWVASSEVGAGAPANETPGAVEAAHASELPAASPEFGFEWYAR
jgi:hypothetical protein